MIQFGLEIEKSGWPKAPKKALRKAISEAMPEVGLFWHDEILEKHFTAGARRRYGYALRSKRYLARKRKEKGHDQDLVFTGKMRNEFLRKATFKSRGRTVSITLPPAKPASLAGKVTRRKNKRGGFSFGIYPDIHAEITATNPGDRQQISRLLAKLIRQNLKQEK